MKKKKSLVTNVPQIKNTCDAILEIEKIIFFNVEIREDEKEEGI